MGRVICDVVVFDLGGVLIDWNPRHLYRKLLPDDASIEEFLAEVCTSEWNYQQDAGRTVAEAVGELSGRHPDKAPLIAAYYERWEEMLGGPIHATVEIFRQLRSGTSLKLYALTNWSAETFPVALELYEFLHWFDGRLVSGEEKMRKPFPGIYQRLIERFGIDPKKAIYVDDNIRNVEPARELGFTGIHFRTPELFKEELIGLGVLADGGS